MRLPVVVATALLCAHAVRSQEGSELEKPFRVEAGVAPISVVVWHPAPFVHDRDGDGLRDLLVGQFGQGRCRVYKNVGTNAAPKFAAEFTWIEAEGKPVQVDAG